MSPTKEFLYKHSPETVNNLSQKHDILKKSIIAQLAIRSEATMAELATTIGSSVPTTTKLVEELVDGRIVEERGKTESGTGRRAALFGLADSSLCFIGIDLDKRGFSFVVTDIHNNIIGGEESYRGDSQRDYRSRDGVLEIVQYSIESAGISIDSLLGVGISLPSWVNPLESAFDKELGVQIILESSARSTLHAEHIKEKIAERNVIYLHMGETLSIGIIIEGELYYGQSGFAGEFGHAPLFDNEIICECGKKGCLQSEVSGTALRRELEAEIGRGVNSSLREMVETGTELHLSDIVSAACANDSLSIEMIGRVGAGAGRAVASLLTLLNPELVIVGGELSQAGDYLMLPLKGAVNRYSNSLLYSGTKIRATEMNRDVAALGAAMVIRNKTIGL